MSSIPGYTLEAFLAWNWNLVVEDLDESNVSVGIAEMIGTCPATRPRLTKEQFSKIVALYEPHRESIEERLDNFDEDNQSWRSYAQYVMDDDEELDDKVKEIIASFG